MKRIVIALVALLAAAHTADADAGTATATFNVNASILAACSASAVDLNFGTYNPAAPGVLTGSTTINVSCTSGTTFTLALSAGSATGSTFTTRHLANGTSLLNYNLYTTSAATTVWGDGSTGTSTVPGTGTGVLTPVAKTVYGAIPINQDLPPGTYTSLITVTVNF